MSIRLPKIAHLGISSRCTTTFSSCTMSGIGGTPALELHQTQRRLQSSFGSSGGNNADLSSNDENKPPKRAPLSQPPTAYGFKAVHSGPGSKPFKTGEEQDYSELRSEQQRESAVSMARQQFGHLGFSAAEMEREVEKIYQKMILDDLLQNVSTREEEEKVLSMLSAQNTLGAEGANTAAGSSTDASSVAAASPRVVDVDAAMVDRLRVAMAQVREASAHKGKGQHHKTEETMTKPVGDTEACGEEHPHHHHHHDAYRCSKKEPLLVLSPEEFADFSEAIFEAHYRPTHAPSEVELDPDLAAAWRQAQRLAAAEVRWIQEWAVAQMMQQTPEQQQKSEGGVTHSGASTNKKEADGDTKEHLSWKDRAAALVTSAVRARVEMEKPLSYILGTQPFFGTTIACMQPVLCPRSETEYWTHLLTERLQRGYDAFQEAEQAKQSASSSAGILNSLLSLFRGSGTSPAADSPATTSLSSSSTGAPASSAPADKSPTIAVPPVNILDVCCGTGCIGIAMVKNLPADTAKVVALDIHPAAVALTAQNAESNGLTPLRPTNRRMKRSPTESTETNGASSTTSSALSSASSAAVPVSSSTSSTRWQYTVRRSDMLESCIINNLRLRFDHWAPLFERTHGDIVNLVRQERAMMPSTLGSCSADDGNHHQTHQPLPPPLPEQFDVIVSNPPYITPNEYEDLPPSVRVWESKFALVGDPRREEQQHTYFRDLCFDGHRLAKDVSDRPAWVPATFPSICIEVGTQGEVVAEMFHKSTLWEDVQLHTDMRGMPRFVTAVKTTMEW